MRIVVVLAVSTLALAGCQTLPGGVPFPGQPAVAEADDGTGALAATIIAAMNGGLVGGSVGAGLSAQEKMRGLEAEYRALEYTPAGEVVAWGMTGANAGYGEVVAAQPYSVGSQNCRQYVQTVTVKGQSKSARGTACRNANGSWTPLT